MQQGFAAAIFVHVRTYTVQKTPQSKLEEEDCTRPQIYTSRLTLASCQVQTSEIMDQACYFASFVKSISAQKAEVILHPQGTFCIP